MDNKKNYKLLKTIEPIRNIAIWEMFLVWETVELADWYEIPSHRLEDHWYIELVDEDKLSLIKEINRRIDPAYMNAIESVLWNYEVKKKACKIE